MSISMQVATREVVSVIVSFCTRTPAPTSPYREHCVKQKLLQKNKRVSENILNKKMMYIKAHIAVLISTIIRHNFVSQVAQATMSPCLTNLLEETRSLLLGTFHILNAGRYIEGT